MGEHFSRSASVELKARLGEDLQFEVCEQDAERRISRWVDVDGSVQVVSSVCFHQAVAEKYPEIHAQILGGKPLGETFKLAQIPFYRNEKMSDRLVGHELEKYFGMKPEQVTVKEVEVFVGDPAVKYADVVEVYRETDNP